jgi:hypothetical protein
MVHRGTTRESKARKLRAASTPDDKFRRHRNKMRIWRRAIKKRLAAEALLAVV